MTIIEKARGLAAAVGGLAGLALAIAAFAPISPASAQTPGPTIDPRPTPTPGIGDLGTAQGEAPRRRRQMPGGAAAPFFELPDAALPFAPQVGTIPGLGLPSSRRDFAPPPAATDRTLVALEARFSAQGRAIGEGMHWRVFADRPEANGAFALIGESRDHTAIFALRPGAYILHAAYGVVQQSQRIEIGTDPMRHTVVMNAGALRLTGKVGEQTIPKQELSFDIFAGGLFDGGEPRLVRRQAPAAELIALPEGTYHIVSAYGDANATIRADVRIRAGRLTDATIHHRASTVSLRLVQSRPGGEPIGNAAWTVLTPGGDVIKESIGAFPRMVLQEGEYLAIARHEGRVFNRRFQVESGKDLNVEVVAR